MKSKIISASLALRSHEHLKRSINLVSKKAILNLGAASLLAFGSLGFTGCGSGADNQVEATHELAEAAYQCPMKCEGDKTYADKGSCPECGMDLAKLEHKH